MDAKMELGGSSIIIYRYKYRYQLGKEMESNIFILIESALASS